MHTRADTGVRAHPRTHPPGFPTSVIMGLQLCVRTTFPDPVSELGALWAGSPQGDVDEEASHLIYEQYFTPMAILAGGGIISPIFWRRILRLREFNSLA